MTTDISKYTDFTQKRPFISRDTTPEGIEAERLLFERAIKASEEDNYKSACLFVAKQLKKDK